MMTETRPPVSTALHGQTRSGNRAWYDVVEEPMPTVPAFEVVYEDRHGRPLIAFDAGQWYDVSGPSGAAPRAISVRQALRRDPAWAGAAVQTMCSWMRRNPGAERSFDLATELALAVGELVRADVQRAAGP